MQRFTALLAFSLAFGLPGSVSAAEPDPHRMFEQACRSCHSEHGADLARQKLALVKNALSVKRTGAPVEQLLKKHHGVTLSAADTTALVDLFRKGITWGGVFQHRCSSCHDRAAEFARAKLTLVDGSVRTKSSNAEVGSLLEMLRYQLETASK